MAKDKKFTLKPVSSGSIYHRRIEKKKRDQYKSAVKMLSQSFCTVWSYEPPKWSESPTASKPAV